MQKIFMKEMLLSIVNIIVDTNCRKHQETTFVFVFLLLNEVTLVEYEVVS